MVTWPFYENSTGDVILIYSYSAVKEKSIRTYTVFHLFVISKNIK